jgi:hypothetical protein
MPCLRDVTKCGHGVGYCVGPRLLVAQTHRIPADFRDLEAVRQPLKSMYSKAAGISETDAKN